MLLIDTNNDVDININDELIKRNFARIYTEMLGNYKV